MTREVRHGRPVPLGVTLEPDGSGANVAVWAPAATGMLLCIFTADGAEADGAGFDTEERIELSARTGGIWHANVEGIGPGTRYGFRAIGPRAYGEGLRFNPHKLLLDPYAQALDAPLRWDPLMDDTDPHTLDERDSAAVVPKSVVLGAPDGPDPRGNRPRHDLADLIIYEAHLKGLTATHPDVPEHLRGTYAGMAHPAIIAHLTSLGVNAVELLPVQAFFDDRNLVERGTSNYWGYQPLAWCAPEPRYAATPGTTDAELRHLVHTLHDAGIEVLIDVVYNHTGEGDERGPTVSLRGLHNRGYYRHAEASAQLIDDTGTGNTVAAEQPMVLRLLLDSLRHWAERYGVDGFRFDLATTIGRKRRGFSPESAFFQAVLQDPVLSELKLVAEPWDLGPGGYQLGNFPFPWSEWNDRFRDGSRRAWRGDDDALTELSALLLGSAGVFDHAHRPATASINFVTAHDGFTLADLVSYLHKHNAANGEGNRDGHDHNHSDNLGIEGPTDDPVIRIARARRARALLGTLLVSQGVPMLLAGDEIGNSQHGNNNAYAQDNELGWVDWTDPDTELLDITRRLIEIRQQHPVLRQCLFLHGTERADGKRDVLWLKPDGAERSESDWYDPDQRCLILQVRTAANGGPGSLGRHGRKRGRPAPVADTVHAPDDADTLLIILNTGSDAEVRLPAVGDLRTPAESGEWIVEIDTARPESRDRAALVYQARGQSVVVLSPASHSEPDA